MNHQSHSAESSDFELPQRSQVGNREWQIASHRSQGSNKLVLHSGHVYGSSLSA